MHKADAQNSDFINIIPSTYKSDSFEINIKANNWGKKNSNNARKSNWYIFPM